MAAKTTRNIKSKGKKPTARVAAKPAAKPVTKAPLKVSPVAAKAYVPVAQASAPAKSTRGGFWHGFWGLGIRLWWSVTWRTVLFISLPVMLVQVIIATLKNPEVPTGLFSFLLMMLSGLPMIFGQLLTTPEFWFFIAVSAWTYIGGIFIFAHLIKKGRAGKLNIEVTARK